MSDPQLERIAEAYAAWNEGDLAKTLAVLSPDVEWHTSASFPGTEPVYRGREGFQRFWGHLHEPWQGIRVEIESFDREGDVVVLRIRFHAIGRESGVPVDLPWFQVLVIEDDQVVRAALDRTVGDALEALDLADAFPEF